MTLSPAARTRSTSAGKRRLSPPIGRRTTRSRGRSLRERVARSMSGETDAFVAFLNEKYGRGRYEGHDESILAMYDTCDRYTKLLHHSASTKPGSPEIHVDIADIDKLNACAFKRDGVYAIALFRDIPRIVKSLFDHILADPESFPGIGDVSREVRPPPRQTLIPDTASM